MERFSNTVELTLKDAGWFAGRNVNDQVEEWSRNLHFDGFEIFPAAERVLAEFGGLIVTQDAPGLSCAREPFSVVPTLAAGEADRFGEFATHLKTRLYPLGEAAGGNCFLAIAENGEVFLIMDDILWLGQNMDQALEKLILGVPPEERMNMQTG